MLWHNYISVTSYDQNEEICVMEGHQKYKINLMNQEINSTPNSSSISTLLKIHPSYTLPAACTKLLCHSAHLVCIPVWKVGFAPGYMLGE